MGSAAARRLTVVIVDYGVGNVHSVASFFATLGHRVEVSDASDKIKTAEIVVLPGVGSARTALGELKKRSLDDAIRARYGDELPIVGICLGAQVLLGPNEEAGGESGTSVIPGSVRRLDSGGTNTGWRALDFEQLREAGLNRGLRATSTFFFNHEFRMHFDRPDVKVVKSTGPSLPAVVLSGRTIGVQFHPEKSQASGRRFMQNVLDYVAR